MELTKLIRRATEVAVEDQPREVDFAEAPGLFVKTIFLPKRESLVPQHSHESGHLTMLALGEIFVWKNGELQGRYKAPTGIYIEPQTKHTFLTLTDNVLLYCIHRVDEGEQGPSVVEEYQFNRVEGI